MDEIIQSLNELENQIKQGSVGISLPRGGADVVIGPPLKIWMLGFVISRK